MGNWVTEFPVHFVSAAGVVFKEDKVLLIRSDKGTYRYHFKCFLICSVGIIFAIAL